MENIFENVKLDLFLLGNKLNRWFWEKKNSNSDRITVQLSKCPKAASSDAYNTFTRPKGFLFVSLKK